MGNLISKNIKAYYKKRLLVPLIYFVFTVLILVFTPFSSMIFTRNFESESLAQAFENKEVYQNFEIKNLYFTGYTKEWVWGTEGYYYYTMMDDECVIVLLSPSTSKQGLSSIEDLRFRGKITRQNAASIKLLQNIAADFNWPTISISGFVCPYMISEPAAKGVKTFFLAFVLISTSVFSFLNVILNLIFIGCPWACPQVRRLRRYGNATKILEEAEIELATLPQLATEDIYITEHYFIELSNYGVAIVPISEIFWIYKHSTLHKFLWRHFAISYTIHIHAKKGLYIKCPKNTLSNIDGIMDYLAEANHDILVGFSEENRLKAETIK